MIPQARITQSNGQPSHSQQQAPALRCLPFRKLTFPEGFVTNSSDASARAFLDELRLHGAAVLKVSTLDGDNIDPCTGTDVSYVRSLLTMLEKRRPGLAWTQLEGKDMLTVQVDHDPESKVEDQACMEMERMARCALRALGTAAGMSVPLIEEVLDPVPLPRGQRSSSYIHANRYHAGATAASPACQPHIDRSIITLIMSDQEQGLQVLSHTTNRWLDVPLGPGKVAVLVGYGLEFITKGALQPVKHRIVPLTAAAAHAAAAAATQAAGQPSQQQEQRLSLAFKLCHRPAAYIIPSLITQHVTLSELLKRCAIRKEALTGAQLTARFEKQIAYSIRRGAAVAAAQRPGLPSQVGMPANAAAAAAGQQQGVPSQVGSSLPANAAAAGQRPGGLSELGSIVSAIAAAAAGQQQGMPSQVGSSMPANAAAAGQRPEGPSQVGGSQPSNKRPRYDEPDPASLAVAASQRTAAGHHPAPAGYQPTPAGRWPAPNGCQPAAGGCQPMLGGALGGYQPAPFGHHPALAGYQQPFMALQQQQQATLAVLAGYQQTANALRQQQQQATLAALAGYQQPFNALHQQQQLAALAGNQQQAHGWQQQQQLAALAGNQQPFNTLQQQQQLAALAGNQQPAHGWQQQHNPAGQHQQANAWQQQREQQAAAGHLQPAHAWQQQHQHAAPSHHQPANAWHPPAPADHQLASTCRQPSPAAHHQPADGWQQQQAQAGHQPAGAWQQQQQQVGPAVHHQPAGAWQQTSGHQQSPPDTPTRHRPAATDQQPPPACHESRQLPDGHPVINIAVRDQGGNEVHFKIHPTKTKVASVVAAYCDIKDVRNDDFKFMYDGVAIWPLDAARSDDTFAWLDMEENDVIDLMIPMIGD